LIDIDIDIDLPCHLFRGKCHKLSQLYKQTYSCRSRFTRDVDRNLEEKAVGTWLWVARRSFWHWLMVPGRRRFIATARWSSIPQSALKKNKTDCKCPQPIEDWQKKAFNGGLSNRLHW